MLTIAEKNDAIRHKLSFSILAGIPLKTRHKLIFSLNVGETASSDKNAFRGILESLSAHSDFSENDTYQEHDFGKFTFGAKDYFFKFDYYDQDLCYWSDPKEENTRHVLTVMEASEY